MNFLVSGNAPTLYPAETFLGLVYCSEEDAIEIPYQYPLQGEWGKPLSNVFEEPKNHDIPKNLDLVYLSIVEEKFYSLEDNIPTEKFNTRWDDIQNGLYDGTLPHIVVGLAPYGLVVLWIVSENKSLVVFTSHAVEASVPMSDFYPTSPSIKLEDICARYLNRNPKAKQNLETNGLPTKDLFDNYMKQFTYRYLPLFEHWNEDEEKWTKYTEEEQEAKPELDYIDEALYDGTHDKLHDGGLLNYHEAGKPKKLAVKWHIKKSEYMAYFWFEDEDIRAVFDKFYGLHPDTKTDFIIHIDPGKKKYQLALYRYGQKEPQVIPEDAYQLIVFKNKFEHYRSDNYDQPRGAWIW